MSRTQTQTLEFRLSLTHGQILLLQSLRGSVQSSHLQASVPSLTVKPRFGVERAIVIAGSAFSANAAQIIVPGIGKLSSKTPISWRGVGFKKKYLCLVEKPDGWSAYIALVKPPRVGRMSPKKGERIHNAAAIFITEKVKPRSVSGGLPSLGKRK